MSCLKIKKVKKDKLILYVVYDFLTYFSGVLSIVLHRY